MKELLDYYHADAKKHIKDDVWYSDIQQNALKDLAHKSFPEKNNEDWKYTSLRHWADVQFKPATTNAGSIDIGATEAPFAPSVVISNAKVQIKEKQLPDGVIIAPLSKALEEHSDKIKPYLGQALRHQNGFQAMNTAMLQSGLFIYLAKNTVLENPIYIKHWQDKDNQAVYLRHIIVAEAGAKAEIIEEYQGKENCCYFTNTMTELYAEVGSTLTHYKIQSESAKAFHIGDVAVNQLANSHYQHHSLSLGGRLVRSDLNIQLKESNASCVMNGIYAPKDGQHVDHHTTVEHLVAHCNSKQDYKGVLSGRSRAVFNGKVIVAKDAQKTDAQQQNKNLLLSKNAEVDTKPQLEIFADDVSCTHGATVGQLDEDAIFYLATRGIGREDAANFLIHAFAGENISLIPRADVAEWVGKLLNQHLG